jgi:protein-disulfide isomerase
MKVNPQRVGEWCMRRLMLCVLLLGVGCQAQSPVSPELERSIEKQVHATFGLPPYVDVKVVERKPSKDFPAFDELRVLVSYGEQSKTQPLLLSKDGKMLYSLTKMDLTRDPLAETMAKMNLSGRPVRGNKDAKVTVVVYDDFQCPYCSRMHQTILDTLKSYGDRIKVVYKDFPLTQIHPWAERAAIDSECLAKQNGDAYWDFADTVHASGRQIQGEHRPLAEQQADVDRMALEAGKRHAVNASALDSCIKAQPRAELEASEHEADSLGVESTPVVFVNGAKMDGAVAEADLRHVLDKALKNAGVEPAAKNAGSGAAATASAHK